MVASGLRPDARPIQKINLPMYIQDDIYRGQSNAPNEANPRDTRDDSDRATISSTSSSSSSASSTSARLVQRALAAVVELAISRWARSSALDGSLSSSSSSSTTSEMPRPAWRRRRRRPSRRGSVSTVAIDPTQRAIYREALEMSRRVPREFCLVTPAYCSSNRLEPLHPQRVVETKSLTNILGQLERVLKTTSREGRDKMTRFRAQENTTTASAPLKTLDEDPGATGQTDRQKAKHKYQKYIVRSGIGAAAREALVSPAGQRAWWLDVASPTWEDMRAIGTLLHLHPLTLEDILQQDPREKLEIFPRLGYYFIVFRAIHSQPVDGKGSETQTLGELHITNIYITVFREGVCSFHFSDIKEHSNRVRTRFVQNNGEHTWMTSDLIAHGLMDSTVDAFIPLMRRIELEVASMDDLVTGMAVDDIIRDSSEQLHMLTSTISRQSPSLEPATAPGELAEVDLNEKPSLSPNRSWTAYCFVVMKYVRSTVLLFFRLVLMRARCLLRNRRRATKSERLQTLLKMSHTRRMVIHLARLLAPKNEILGHLRRRLAFSDLTTHLDDVQDHILTMQQSLHYYERVLSHSHPAYLSYLNVSLSQAKGGTDMAILWLSFVSIGTICLQFPIGLFSMNVHIPGNRRPPRPLPPGWAVGEFRWFGMVISIDTLLVVLFVAVLRFWWVKSKKK